ncbi:MAG: hypothetical protein C4567_18705 [Deltaproteobacteria bacterium]|nr:MAG: hypothetical protein C4567_18705 [Deltaproteobacteria bacterium]
MEPHSFLTGLGGVSQLQGLTLILCVFALLWYSTFRSQRKGNAENNRQMKELYEKVMGEYKANRAEASAQHLQAAKEMRQMYDNNAILVEKVVALSERYEKRGEYLERLIQNNIQCWQETIDAVKSNKFCPRVRELEGKG